MGLLRRRGNGGSDVDGFLPIIAPDDFIRPTDYQYFGCSVNLYEIFNIYRTAISGFDAKWVTEIYDNGNHSVTGNTFNSYMYGYAIYNAQGDYINSFSFTIPVNTTLTNIFPTNSETEIIKEKWFMIFSKSVGYHFNITQYMKWVYIGGEFWGFSRATSNNWGIMYLFIDNYRNINVSSDTFDYSSDSGFTHILSGTLHMKGGLIKFGIRALKKALAITRLECDNIGFDSAVSNTIQDGVCTQMLNMSGEIVIAPNIVQIGSTSVTAVNACFYQCPMITSVKMQSNAPIIYNPFTFNLQTPAPIPLYLPTGATGYDTGIWADTTKFTQIRY